VLYNDDKKKKKKRSGFASLGPGMIPARRRLAVWYLVIKVSVETTQRIYKNRYCKCGGRFITECDIRHDVCDGAIWLRK
jgi:hypothetical protein